MSEDIFVFDTSTLMRGMKRACAVLSSEIIQDSSLVSVHKGHSVQLGIFMLYRALAGVQTKPATAAINCSSGQKRKVNQTSV